MKHYPETPTTCDTSDMLNEIARFVDDNPNWYEDASLCTRMTLALQVLRITCPDPASCTDEEYEFVMDICKTLSEVSQ
jgi:hypothetical protein